MAKDLSKIRSYGDDASGVWVAPKGTALPTDMATPLNAAFKELGWLSEDGVPEETSADSTEFKAWQGGATIKKKRTAVGFKATANALEDNEVVRGIEYRGQVGVVTAGVTRYNRKNLTQANDLAVVIDYYDGGYRKRTVMASADATITGATEHKNDALTVKAIEFVEQGDGGYTLYADPVTP